MDNVEQRIEQIEKFASQCYDDGAMYSGFISGAIWADNNLAQDVVDLNDVWHDVSEVPEEKSPILCDDRMLSWGVLLWGFVDAPWEWFCKIKGITKWAYISDLLPKGGKK